MTELEVCNWALLKLGQRPIAGIGEDSFKADCCRLLLSPIRRSLLRSFAWNFAIEETVLTACSTGSFYPLPKGCFKVLKLNGEGVVRGNCIFSPQRGTSPLSVEYIANIEISGCDPLVQEAIACKLASELAPILTADIQLTLRLKAEFEEVKKTAIDMDGIEVCEPREY